MYDQESSQALIKGKLKHKCQCFLFLYYLLKGRGVIWRHQTHCSSFHSAHVCHKISLTHESKKKMSHMGGNRQKIARRKFILRFAYVEVDFFLITLLSDQIKSELTFCQ